MAKHDNNLVVIGAGSAGLIASLIAATVKARVTLIERDRMGGDCLHTGCVPSKALIRAARVAHEFRQAERRDPSMTKILVSGKPTDSA